MVDMEGKSRKQRIKVVQEWLLEAGKMTVEVRC